MIRRLLSGETVSTSDGFVDVHLRIPARPNAARLIPDELVARLALAGTTDGAAARVATLRAPGIDSNNAFPLGTDRLGTIRQFAPARSARAAR